MCIESNQPNTKCSSFTYLSKERDKKKPNVKGIFYFFLENSDRQSMKFSIGHHKRDKTTTFTTFSEIRHEPPKHLNNSSSKLEPLKPPPPTPPVSPPPILLVSLAMLPSLLPTHFSVPLHFGHSYIYGVMRCTSPS